MCDSAISCTSSTLIMGIVSPFIIIFLACMCVLVRVSCLPEVELRETARPLSRSPAVIVIIVHNPINLNNPINQIKAQSDLIL